MKDDSIDKRAVGYYTEINVFDKKDEIVELLKPFNPTIHTNAEKDFDYLPDEGVSIIVLRDEEEVLYVDLEGEITLGIGGWHTHYAPYLIDYNMFKETLTGIIAGRVCAVCIKCRGEWMLSFITDETEVSEQELVRQTSNQLSAEEFRKKLNKYGFSIQCSFLDSSKDRLFTVEQNRL